MIKELEITHFTQLPKTEVVCGAGRSGIIRHYPSDFYLEWWDGGNKPKNKHLGRHHLTYIEKVKNQVENCRRCVDSEGRNQNMRECDQRPKILLEPQPADGEVIFPYLFLLEKKRLTK